MGENEREGECREEDGCQEEKNWCGEKKKEKEAGEEKEEKMGEGRIEEKGAGREERPGWFSLVLEIRRGRGQEGDPLGCGT